MADAPRIPEGRSLRWRVGAMGVGLVLAGTAAGLWFHPEFLSYAVAGVLAVFALLAITSALTARGD